MTDYLAAARDHAAAVDGATFGSPAYLAHLTAVTALASLAIADALPQGTEDRTGETTGPVASSPSPAEHVCRICRTCGVCHQYGHPEPEAPALVALDHAEAEAVTALIEWRKVDRLYPPEAPEAWPALLRLRDVADRLGLAR